MRLKEIIRGMSLVLLVDNSSLGSCGPLEPLEVISEHRVRDSGVSSEHKTREPGINPEHN